MNKTQQDVLESARAWLRDREEINDLVYKAETGTATRAEALRLRDLGGLSDARFYSDDTAVELLGDLVKAFEPNPIEQLSLGEGDEVSFRWHSGIDVVGAVVEDIFEDDDGFVVLGQNVYLDDIEDLRITVY